MSDVPDRIRPDDPRQLRASDADRERVAEVLRSAATEGRLGLDELEERLGEVYAARTYAELEPVTRDLPTSASVAPAGNAYPRIGGTPTSTGAVALLGGFERKGAWVVPKVFTCVAVMGGGEIDLRQARFAEAEVTIRAFAFMGGISILVPEDAEVHVSGTGIMGGFSHDATGGGRPGAPRIIVTGLAVWGGVDVERRPGTNHNKRGQIHQ
jgi:hypothetical protein